MGVPNVENGTIRKLG